MDNDGVHAFLFTTKKEKRKHAPALLRECAVLFRQKLVVLLERGGRVRGKWERWWERERERERESTFRLSLWDKSINNQSEARKEREREREKELLFFSETLNNNARELPVSFPFLKTRERIIEFVKVSSTKL